MRNANKIRTNEVILKDLIDKLYSFQDARNNSSVILDDIANTFKELDFARINLGTWRNEYNDAFTEILNGMHTS